MNQAVWRPAAADDDDIKDPSADGTAAVSVPSPPANQNRHQYAGREWTSDHPLNLRMSVPLPFGRYYITVVAGRERRARARLSLVRRQHPLSTPGNILFLFLLGLVTIAGSLSIAYMLLSHLSGGLF